MHINNKEVILVDENVNLKFAFIHDEEIESLRSRFYREVIAPFNEKFKWFNNENLNCPGCNLYMASKIHNCALVAQGVVLTTNQSNNETVTFEIKIFRNGYGQIKSGDLLITEHWREIFIRIARLINEELLMRIKYYSKHVEEVEQYFDDNNEA